MPAIEGIVRAQLAHNRADDKTPDRLREIAFRGETSEWREWARQRVTQLAP